MIRDDRALLDRGFVGGLDLGPVDAALAGCWLVAVTEKRTRAEIDAFVVAAAAHVAGRSSEASAPRKEAVR